MTPPLSGGYLYRFQEFNNLFIMLARIVTFPRKFCLIMLRICGFASAVSSIIVGRPPQLSFVSICNMPPAISLNLAA